MTDREMLELAAKAAGFQEPKFQTYDGMKQRYGFDCAIWTGEDYWNPLESDGDALRLAVKLCLELDICHSGIAVRTSTGHKVLVSPEDEADPYAATRRAIVRAAAQIGRAMG